MAHRGRRAGVRSWAGGGWSCREAGAEPADFSRLRLRLSGGASMPVETLRAAEKLYGVPVLEGYGLSENAGACFFNPVDAPTRPGTVGRPVDGFEQPVFAWR